MFFYEQSPISFPDQKKMMAELKNISDVSNAIKAVEISIGFLTSTINPADKEQPYEKYLKDVLRMDDVEKYLPSRKVRNIFSFCWCLKKPNKKFTPYERSSVFPLGSRNINRSNFQYSSVVRVKDNLFWKFRRGKKHIKKSTLNCGKMIIVEKNIHFI